MLLQLNAERSRPAGGRRAAKGLRGALGGLAVTLGAFGWLTAAAPGVSAARTLSARLAAVELSPRAKRADARGDLGLGLDSAGRRAAYPRSGCRGPRGYGMRFLGDRWPGGFRGVPVFSNGTSGSFTACIHWTRTPRGRVVVDGYAWQCVELVDRLYLSKGWIESTWRGNGNQMFYTAPPNLARQRQGHIGYVHPGDVISYDSPGGGYGHAAVVSRVRGSFLTIVNQNTDRANMISHAYLRQGRIEMIGWAGWRPIGVVHHPWRRRQRK